MEKITTDIATFANLRGDGYTYVDKTDLLCRLVANTEGRQFFISRPRRFGKSLMLSTLKCIFEGRRELFKGLINETLYRIYAKIPPEWRIRSEADVKRHFLLFMEMAGAKVAAEEGSARGYANAYKGDRRSVTLVGINFRTTKRNIDEPVFAKMG